MPETWSFGESHDHSKTYADGTVVPSREWPVLIDGKEIGEIEVHMHKRRGRDGRTDVSFGITAVVYGPAPGGN